MDENRAEAILTTAQLQAYGLSFTFNENEEFGGLLVSSLANNQVFSVRLRAQRFRIVIEEIEAEED